MQETVPKQMQVKVCGIKTREQLSLLNKYGVRYAGLWYGINDGIHNLDEKALSNLVSTKFDAMEFVIVTTLGSLKSIATIIEHTQVPCLQLHGFQSPAFVQQIRRYFGGSIKLFKVLHVDRNRCLEEHFIDRYIDAGIDTLIFDNYQDMARIGSTGQMIREDVLLNLISRYSQRASVMVAGGIDEYSLPLLASMKGVVGVDIDSAARSEGKISEPRIARLMQAHNDFYSSQEMTITQ